MRSAVDSLPGRSKNAIRGQIMAEPRTKRASEKEPEPALPPQAVTDDPVEEASKESFPASDSPAWNAGHDPLPSNQKK
jgi:hypothetical protein